MFWKKKRNSPDSDLAVGAVDKREHFRVRLPPELPVVIRLDNRECPVRDLSAGGVAFEMPKPAPVSGTVAQVILRPGDVPIRVRLAVVRIDERGVCHACFENISDADQGTLHRFVLEVQKHLIRATREQRMVADDEL